MTLALNFVNENTSRDFFSTEVNRLANFCADTYAVKFDKICVGVSGGADSLSLLLLTKQWADVNGAELYCVTVDHQLRTESAEEASFVKNICKENGIFHQTLIWQHEDSNIPHAKLENAAREARYQLLTQFCREHDIHIIMTGHHWNDQLETYEMRRDFHSSDSGLAGMSQVRSLTSDILLVRPLLHFSKKHLQDFLRPTDIVWKEDPMNTQAEFLRVNYRRKIYAYHEQKIAEMSAKIMQLGEHRHVVETAAVRFLKTGCEFTKYGYAILNKEKLLLEENVVQQEIFKRVIWTVGGKKYATLVLDVIASKIISRKINTIGRCFIKHKKNKIYVFRENRNIPIVTVKGKSLKWDNRFLINFNVELSDCVIQSSCLLEDTDIPREACAGYPGICKKGDNDAYIHDSEKYDIVFMKNANLFDVFI